MQKFQPLTEEVLWEVTRKKNVGLGIRLARVQIMVGLSIQACFFLESHLALYIKGQCKSTTGNPS